MRYMTYRPLGESDHLCECGCGRFTQLIALTNTARGHVKGEPRKYCFGHHPGPPRRVFPGVGTGRLCGCGCGRETVYTDALGIPKYLPGHLPPKRQKQLALDLGPRRKQRFEIDPQTGCWVWLRKVETCGYPSLSVDGHVVKGHRFYYEQYKGPIPEGFHVHHECRNKLCVNPSHLTALSPDEHALEHLIERLGSDRVLSRVGS